MIFFYIIAIILFLFFALSISATLDRIAKNLGVVATCNLLWMQYHGNETEIKEAGAILAKKVAKIGVEDVGT